MHTRRIFNVALEDIVQIQRGLKASFGLAPAREEVGELAEMLLGVRSVDGLDDRVRKSRITRRAICTLGNR